MQTQKHKSKIKENSTGSRRKQQRDLTADSTTVHWCKNNKVFMSSADN